MKILIYSPDFYPKVGGLTTFISILANEFVQRGHQVKLVTWTLSTDNHTFPYEIIRYPSVKQLLHLTHWCEVYFQAGLSLRGIWPLLIVPRTLVVTHQGWYGHSDRKWSWQELLKHFITRFSINIATSQAVADHLAGNSTVIPNSYQDHVFYEIPSIERNKELVFLGRLVSDKGVNLLLDALANLKQIGLTPQLTIIGNGPEEENLRQQAQQLTIADQVNFVGVKVEAELARLLNIHQILVVPSLWQEPFGIVALEGIACGCVVVGSQGGGLKDAIGPCGMTFPNGDAQALTQALLDLLKNPDRIKLYRKQAICHLSRHKPTAVASAYLEVLEKTLR